MNALELLNSGSYKLQKQKIKTHRLDSEILLSKVLNKSREQILIRLNQNLNISEVSEFDNLIQRRLRKEPIAYILKARTTLLRDMGAAMSPFNAFMFIQGLETLALRVREHSKNASKVAEFLKSHPQVESVSHPSVAEGIYKERAEKYLSGGNGGLLGFEIKGGLEAGKKFIDSLEMFYHVANIQEVLPFIQRVLRTHS